MESKFYKRQNNLHYSHILCHIGSRELPRRSGYYKRMWYGAIGAMLNTYNAILDSSSDTYVIRTSVPEMRLFQFGFSQRSGDVGEKEVEGEKEVDERQTNTAEALQTLEETACCEQGFSVMGKTKSDWRSCLSVVLDCLMRIRIEGRTIAEFDPQPGLDFWWSSGSRMRHPLFND